MAQTVFILGAGASQRAGGPLMNNFLDASREAYRHGTADAFEAVQRGIGSLQQVHSKARLDIHNIESVFAAFEMAKTLNRLPEYDEQDIGRLIAETRKLIYQTLDATIRFPIDPEDQKIHAAIPYGDFYNLVITIKHSAERSVALLTFNYDICLDQAFMELPIDYGLLEKNGGTALLKLHGSLNWVYCEYCNTIICCPAEEFVDACRARTHWELKRPHDKVGMRVGSLASEFLANHCRHTHPGESSAGLTPFIVPPVWNKTEYHRQITPVWERAAAELRDAEDILVIGYSLPETDMFFRYMFALGTAGGNPLRRIAVFDPDVTGVVKERFKKLLGPGAEERFEYYQLPFIQAIDVIGNFYRKKDAL